MRVIEALFYSNPHKTCLCAQSPVMKSIWRKCAGLTRGKGSIMAPLLVDDRPQERGLCVQTVDDVIRTTTGRTYESFRWFRGQVSEIALEERHGKIGCTSLDAYYHLEVIGSLSTLFPEWKWIVVHPDAFKDQQAGMLAEVWQFIAPDFSPVAEVLSQKKETLHASLREAFFNRFRHLWVSDDGRIQECTRPVYKGGAVIHVQVEDETS